MKSQIEAEGRESEERRVQFESALKEEEQSKLKEKEALLDDLVYVHCSCAGMWIRPRVPALGRGEEI